MFPLGESLLSPPGRASLFSPLGRVFLFSPRESIPFLPPGRAFFSPLRESILFLPPGSTSLFSPLGSTSPPSQKSNSLISTRRSPLPAQAPSLECTRFLLPRDHSSPPTGRALIFFSLEDHLFLPPLREDCSFHSGRSPLSHLWESSFRHLPPADYFSPAIGRVPLFSFSPGDHLSPSWKYTTSTLARWFALPSGAASAIVGNLLSSY